MPYQASEDALHASSPGAGMMGQDGSGCSITGSSQRPAKQRHWGQRSLEWLSAAQHPPRRGLRGTFMKAGALAAASSSLPASRALSSGSCAAPSWAWGASPARYVRKKLSMTSCRGQAIVELRSEGYRKALERGCRAGASRGQCLD